MTLWVTGRLRYFWRWLTCGHGHHAWQRRLGIDLADGLPGEFVIGWYCPRCGTVKVVETHPLRSGMVVRYRPGDLDFQIIPEVLE